MIDAPASRAPLLLGDEQRDHQRLEHAPAPARHDVEAPKPVMPLEHGHAEIRPDLSTRDLRLRPTCREGAEEAEVMFGRDLLAGDRDVADDPRLGVEHPVECGEGPVVGVVTAVEMAGPIDGIGRVERAVEEAEVHRTEQRIGLLPERGSGVADHHQRGGEPAVIDARKEGARCMGLVPTDAHTGPALERRTSVGRRRTPWSRFHPTERGQGRPEPPVGLGVVDQAERPGRQGGPEISGDVRRRGPLRRLPLALIVALEAIGREPDGAGHQLDRMPGAPGVPEQLVALADFGTLAGSGAVGSERHGSHPQD